MRVLSDVCLRRRGGATLFIKVGPRLRRGLLLAMVGAFNATRHPGFIVCILQQSQSK